jgi:hypothetical protein
LLNALLLYWQTPFVKQKNASLFGLTVNSLSHFSISDIAFFTSSVLIQFLTGLCGLKNGAILIAFCMFPYEICFATSFCSTLFTGLPPGV